MVPAEAMLGQMQAVLAPFLAKFDHIQSAVAGSLGEMRDMIGEIKREQGVARGHLDAVVTELASHRTVQAEHTDRLTTLEQRVEALQISGPQGVGGATGSAGDDGFVPAFVELEGWTTWADRGTHGVTRVQAEAHVEGLRGAAPAGLREHIGRVVLSQHMNCRVRVLVGGWPRARSPGLGQASVLGWIHPADAARC